MNLENSSSSAPEEKKESSNDYLNEKVAEAPTSPGVYLMKNCTGEIIYVGKATSLKKRLASYFSESGPGDIKTRALVRKIASFDVILTSNETEALILESNLIKKHKPRYNVILKDGKRYPLLRLSVHMNWPILTVARKIVKDGALYFGPFPSARAMRETLKLIHKTFRLRKCRFDEPPKRTRPCLHHQMNACLAPCCLPVDPKTYGDIVREVTLLLKGKTPELLKKLELEMKTAASDFRFEEAAILRDRLFAIRKTIEKQVAVTTDFMDRDVIAIAANSESCIATILFARGGFLLGSRHYDLSEALSSPDELMSAFIRRYYEKHPFVPREIFVSVPPEDTPAITEWLREVRKGAVSILRPVRGEKAKLLDMAVSNAEEKLKSRTDEHQQRIHLLERLGKRLKINRPPLRIECLDNSNLSGTHPVAGLVVFQDGAPEKSAYKKYHIKNVPEQDDYAYMREILRRRFGKKNPHLPDPDLFMVDGGKGQIHAAMTALGELDVNVTFPIIGIAKKKPDLKETLDKIYIPERSDPVNFSRDKDLLLFLMRIRDEAHRFAVSFHRQKRKKAGRQSILDGIPGIGKKRKTLLLQHFKSIDAIRKASPGQIAELPGMHRKIAEQLVRYLQLH